ncbi:MAG: hypothetical protein Q4C89_10325 [Deinococcus sp.]|uniref:hypothetical protein n=1 Tax=Deinococcus sp. TaxID=47478 RepID=UPI0026DACE2E|nr:hypothetical protein [Deinococcus sp.]MDO4246408.1 hypothetical protein [Deinococcus sp.]
MKSSCTSRASAPVRKHSGDPLALDSALLDDLAARTVEAGTALVPTLSVHEELAEAEAPDLLALPLGDLEGEIMTGLKGQWTHLYGATDHLRRVVRGGQSFSPQVLRERAAAQTFPA